MAHIPDAFPTASLTCRISRDHAETCLIEIRDALDEIERRLPEEYATSKDKVNDMLPGHLSHAIVRLNTEVGRLANLFEDHFINKVDPPKMTSNMSFVAKCDPRMNYKVRLMLLDEAESASDAAQVEAAETAEKAEKGEKGKKRGDNGDVSCGMAGPAKCETQTKQRKKKAPTENVKVE